MNIHELQNVPPVMTQLIIMPQVQQQQQQSQPILQQALQAPQQLTQQQPQLSQQQPQYTTLEPSQPQNQINQHNTYSVENNQPQTQDVKPNVETLAAEKTKELRKKKKEAIDGQAKEIIFRVIKFFEKEKSNRGYTYPVENVVKRACAATGLSESTIKRIKRDGIRAEATQTKMQGPKKTRVRKSKVQLDYFQLCALRGIVNSYTENKEVPTLAKILAKAREELNYKGGKESLRLILLNKLGIKFMKCEKKVKKPPEESMQPPPPPQQPMQTMMHQQMQPMKPILDNQCTMYAPMMHQVPPVSY